MELGVIIHSVFFKFPLWWKSSV